MDKAIDLYAEGTRLLDENPARCIELLTQAIELQPDLMAAWYNRACALARLGRAKEALRDVEQLTRLDAMRGNGLRDHFRFSAIPTVDIGYSFLEDGNLSRARHHFETALTYDPECEEAKSAMQILEEKELAQINTRG